MKKNRIVRNKERIKLELILNISYIFLLGILLGVLYLGEYGILNDFFNKIGLLALTLPILILFLMFWLREKYQKKSNALEEDYITPEDYEYSDDNKMLIKKLTSNIKKRGYFLKSKETSEYEKIVYNKQSIRLVLISSLNLDDKVKRIIEDEVEKCKKYNISHNSRNRALQIIAIVENSYIYLDDFYETEILFVEEMKYGEAVAGFVIPFVVDKNNKKVIIPGFKTKDSRLFRHYKFQKNLVKALFKGII